MPEDKLEEPDFLQHKKNPIFSKIALCFSISNLSLIIYSTVHPARRVAAPPGQLIAALAFLSVMLGLFCSIISLFRKEKLKFGKAIGVAVNVGLFLFLLVAVVFAIVMKV